MQEVGYLYGYQLSIEKEKYNNFLNKKKKETKELLDDINFKVNEITGIQKVLSKSFAKELNKESKFSTLLHKLDIMDVDKLKEEQDKLQDVYAMLYGGLCPSSTEHHKNNDLIAYERILSSFESEISVYSRIVKAAKQKYNLLTVKSSNYSRNYKHDYTEYLKPKSDLDNEQVVEIVCSDDFAQTILKTNFYSTLQYHKELGGRVIIVKGDSLGLLQPTKSRKTYTFEGFKTLNNERIQNELAEIEKKLEYVEKEIEALDARNDKFSVTPKQYIDTKKYLHLRKYILESSLKESEYWTEQEYLTTLELILEDVDKLNYMISNKRLPLKVE